ncbi:hypothetical protein D3C86_1527190 [compost metagenome]
MHCDARRVVADRLIIFRLEIGRQCAFMRLGVTAREGLPGEIIVAEREVAGELFEPLLQHGGNRAVVGKACQLVILSGRNAEAEKRAFALRQPAHYRLVE